MGDKLSQPTTVLIKRLRRVAKYHDKIATSMGHPADAARANTCWQSAGRLEELKGVLDSLDRQEAQEH